MAWAVAWLVATTLHAGFQLTVTLVVYPAFARVPASAWTAFHARHSRGIAPLVGLLYGALLVTAAGALAAAVTAGSAAGVPLWLAVSLAGAAASLATTALVAAPLHTRLGAGADPALLRRLLRADAVRTLGALIGLGGAVAHLVTGP